MANSVVKIRRGAYQKRTAEQVANVLAKRGLSVQQRLAVHALVMTTTRTQAIKLLEDNGVLIDKSTLSRWLKQGQFIEALQYAEATVADSITKHSVLRKTETLLNEAMTPRPVLYQGIDTGFTEVELGTATRLVELQGKAVKLFDDDSATKIAVSIDIDFSGRKEPAPLAPVTDVEFVEAKDDSWLE